MVDDETPQQRREAAERARVQHVHELRIGKSVSATAGPRPPQPRRVGRGLLAFGQVVGNVGVFLVGLAFIVAVVVVVVLIFTSGSGSPTRETPQQKALEVDQRKAAQEVQAIREGR